MVSLQIHHTVASNFYKQMSTHHLQNILAENHQQLSSIELDKWGTLTAANQAQKVAMDRPHTQATTCWNFANGNRVQPARKQRTRPTQANQQKVNVERVSKCQHHMQRRKKNSTESYPMEEPCGGSMLPRGVKREKN